MRLPAFRFAALSAACLLAACTGTAKIQVTPTEPEGKGPSVRRSGTPGPAATPSAKASAGTAISPTLAPGSAAPSTVGIATPGFGSFSPPPVADLVLANVVALTGKVKAVAGVLANNGATLLGNNGATLISDKGALYGLRAVDESVIAGTAVYVAGPDGNPLPGVKPVLTDAEGNYKLENVPQDRAYVVRALIKTAAGKDAALETIGKATANPAPLLISTATAMVTAAIYDGKDGDLTRFDPAKFQAAVDATAAKLTAADIPDFANRADVLAKVDKLSKEVAELKSAIDDLKAQLKKLEDKVDELGDKIDDFLNGTPKPTPPPQFLVSTLAGSPTQGFADGKGAAAKFTKPVGVVVDPAGGYYVTEFNNHTVRHVAADGTVTTYAGVGGTAGHADGPRLASQFAAPTGLAINPDGNLYVAEYGANCLRRITPQGEVFTLVGDGMPESKDGDMETGRLNGPCGLVRDPDNNLFIAEFEGNKIRKLSPTGQLTTIAGSGEAGSADGTGAAAKLNKPYGLAWDPSTATLVVADNAGNAIRRVTREGVVTTIAGGGAGAFADGKGAAARFWGPVGVAVAADGTIYVGDTKNGRIRRVKADGTVDTIAGSGATGYGDGAPGTAQLGAPYLMTVDAGGYLVFADYPNHCVRRVKLP